MKKRVVEISGNSYELLQDAYIDGHGGNVYYTALAVNLQTREQVRLRWEILAGYDPEWMEEDVACKWDEATII